MSLPEQQEPQEIMMREFLEYQKLELANKREEIQLRRDEIASNERIALASIAAQKEDMDKRGEVFITINKSRFIFFGAVAILLTAIFVVAMMTQQTDIAMELIKMGGAVILGYIAGINRGKAQVLEKKPNNQD